MVEDIGKGGKIYDSTSIKNTNEYEEAIRKKCSQGIEIARIICSEDSDKNLDEFITPPKSYDPISSKATPTISYPAITNR